MIKVIEPLFGTELEYETITDFVDDVVTGEYIEEVLNQDLGNLELPLNAGEFGYGTVIRKVTDEFTWDAIKDDYIQFFCEEIEDELDRSGSTEFYDYIIKESEEK